MQKPGEATCGYPKPSRWLMQPAMAVQSGLHVCADWSEPLLVGYKAHFLVTLLKLLNINHLQVLSAIVSETLFMPVVMMKMR